MKLRAITYTFKLFSAMSAPAEKPMLDCRKCHSKSYLI